MTHRFPETIEKERIHIRGEAVATHAATYGGLSQKLTEIDENYNSKDQEALDTAKDITTPLKDVELFWISEDGKQTGTVNVGNRMRKLQKTLDAEKEELDRH